MSDALTWHCCLDEPPACSAGGVRLDGKALFVYLNRESNMYEA
jgi:hypothetical protein